MIGLCATIEVGVVIVVGEVLEVVDVLFAALLVGFEVVMMLLMLLLLLLIFLLLLLLGRLSFLSLPYLSHIGRSSR